MKNKFMAVSFAASLLACAALAATLASRARATEDPPKPFGFSVIASDADTKVYFLEHDGHHCYLASTRGGSGVSLQCLK